MAVWKQVGSIVEEWEQVVQVGTVGAKCRAGDGCRGCLGWISSTQLSAQGGRDQPMALDVRGNNWTMTSLNKATNKEWPSVDRTSTRRAR